MIPSDPGKRTAERETECDETPTRPTACPGSLSDPMAETLRRIAAEQVSRILRSIQDRS